jgi:cytochrome c biogenesis protein CcmG/thiol:disulfide interchange protein DsbE
MNTRWIIAAVAAVGLALVSVLLVSTRLATRDAPAGESAAAPSPGVSGAPTTACDPAWDAARFDFTLTDMNGAQVDLTQYEGRPTLLNFWATWCGPCKHEIPELIALQDEFRDEGFTVLGVSVDDPAEALQEFAADYGMNYPVLMANQDIQDAYGPLFAIPVTFLIKQDGTVCRRHFGPMTAEQAEASVRALF